jgi:hypothetical protein
MITARTGKGYFTEAEVARELGISMDDLRLLVRQHILPESEEDMANLPMTSFQPSDLLLLRLLVTGRAAPIAAG